jgi:2-polyprenyl-6-hydroxyphenyl methylase/3-demethylubiquinone-9 3-methyltransferase
LFDAVLVTEVIEHVAHPDQFLAQAAEFVAPGGCVILTTPNGGYFRNTLPKFTECVDPAKFEAVQFRPDADGHIFLLHPEELVQMGAKANLDLEKLKLFTTPLTNGHLKTESLLRVLPGTIVQGLERVAQALPAVVGKRLLAQIGARFRKRLDSSKPAG